MKYSTYFFLRTEKKNDKGLAPLYLRITCSGQRTELSLNKLVDAAKWDAEGQRLKGRTDESKEIEDLKLKYIEELGKCSRKFLDNPDNILSVNVLKGFLIGEGASNRTLLKAYERYIEYLKTRKVKESRFQKFSSFRDHLVRFIAKKYSGKEDVYIGIVDHAFTVDFQMYLRNNGVGINASLKYIGLLKAVVRRTLIYKWITTDPFINFRGEWTKPEKKAFTEAEFTKLLNYPLEPKEDRYRDLFAFSMLTGLAFGDLENLNRSHIVTDPDGLKSICIDRKKTEVNALIPLHFIALEIIEKYKNDPRLKNDCLLPVPSNSNYNKALKTIGARIFPDKSAKYFVTHAGRHTYVNISVNSGIDRNSIVASSGWKDEKELKTYSTVSLAKVTRDYTPLLNKDWRSLKAV